MTTAKFISVFFVGVFAAIQLAAQDIAAFWQKTRERLAREPMNAQVSPVTEALPYKKFQITLRSLDGVLFRAWLALPVQGESPAKPWPVIVTMPGYGGVQQGVMLSECQRGYAILQVFPRGQGDSAELWKINGDKLTKQLDHPEGAYYQRAYADVIRAIDFVESREDLDRDRIALIGTSQGGGMALAVAALDSRVKVAVAHLPFLCNFRLAAQATNSLVKKLLAKTGAGNETAFRTLDYFDPWQLASQLNIPVLMSAGGKDEACPMATIQSVYERVPHSKKTLKIYPELTHTSCVEFYNYSWLWLEQNFRKAS